MKTEKFEVTSMKRIKKIGIIVAAVCLLVAAGVAIYAGDCYRADESAQAAMMEHSLSDTVVCDVEKGMTVFVPAQPKVGLIFYPGGKVEYTAYAPLLRMLAGEGILCVAVEMPLNLAVLDVDAAADIPGRFAEIERWYIGGHSLGGSMAASHAAEHGDAYAGLILLAAYSTADLRESELDVLSIYGSEDGVLNMEKYGQYRDNLPEDVVEYVIEGGNHAQFGSYGIQEGDGEAAITAEEQTIITAMKIVDLIQE